MGVNEGKVGRRERRESGREEWEEARGSRLAKANARRRKGLTPKIIIIKKRHQ